MARVAVLGNTGVDIMIRGALPAELGADSWTDRNVRFLDEAPTVVLAGNGGAAAYVMGRLGQHVTLVTSVGKDQFGQMARERLAEARVEIRSRPDAMTPVNLIGISEAGGRSSAYYTGSKVPWDLVLEDEVDWVYAAGYGQVGATDLDLLTEVFQSTDARVAFDPGPWLARDPFLSTLLDMVDQVDCLLGTEEELGAVADERELDAIASTLISKGVTCVVVKRGGDGALAATGSERVVETVDPIEAAHSVGAGDCFNGAFLSTYIDGGGLQEALRSANDLAGRVVSTGRGATGAFDA